MIEKIKEYIKSFQNESISEAFNFLKSKESDIQDDYASYFPIEEQIEELANNFSVEIEEILVKETKDEVGYKPDMLDMPL